MKNRGLISLRGSTLSEVLVTMVLSGIVLLALYDGFDIAGKALRRTALESKGDVLAGHCALEIMMMQSDSLCKTGNMLVFFSCGKPCDTLIFGDDEVLQRKGGRNTVLFAEYSGYSVSQKIDSLCIKIYDSRQCIMKLEYGLRRIR